MDFVLYSRGPARPSSAPGRPGGALLMDQTCQAGEAGRMGRTLAISRVEDICHLFSQSTGLYYEKHGVSILSLEACK